MGQILYKRGENVRKVSLFLFSFLISSLFILVGWFKVRHYSASWLRWMSNELHVVGARVMDE